MPYFFLRLTDLEPRDEVGQGKAISAELLKRGRGAMGQDKI